MEVVAADLQARLLVAFWVEASLMISNRQAKALADIVARLAVRDKVA